MGDLDNCKNCGKLFVRTNSEVCSDCRKEEEKKFQIVYDFMKKRINRQATVQQIVEGTGVEEELIIKFVKEKRLRATQFPNLSYPCEKCGAKIQEGKLCNNCSKQLSDELAYQDKIDQVAARNEQKERERARTYFAIDKMNEND